MKSGIKVENAVFCYRGRRTPLLSGEFHYWRVLRDNWPAIIERIKDMGLEVVASYIPWNYHELAPGKYDFTGRTSPQRDLAGFLDLLADKGMKVIIRPGPYIYAEWENGGPPARAVKHDRLSPEFLAMAEDYITAVCKYLAPRQITRGGNIIMCQADNEPYPPIESFGNQIGCFRDRGMFKDWLREKYAGDLAEFNRRWRANYASFDEACFYFHEPYVNTTLPMAQRLLSGREYQVRYGDCFEFIGWYAAKIVQTVGAWLRAAGIEVPVFANSWSPLYADFGRFCAVAELAGTDIYPERFISGKAIAADNWQYNIDILKMAEADVTGGNVWSAEFQSGNYPISHVGHLPPQHFQFVPSALMARGLKGWNWYMLVSRDNWYCCPINEWGRTNENYPYHAKAVAIARKVAPWQRESLDDVGLVVDKTHRVISPGNYAEVFRVLEEGDFSYHYYNPRSGKAPRSRIMVYCGDDWLERPAAARLAEFVAGGGTLVAFSRMPVEDEYGESLAGLPFRKPEGARPVNLPCTIAYRRGRIRVENAGHMGCKVNFCYFREVPGEPVTVTLSGKAKELLVDIGAPDVSTFAIGFARRVGRGKIIQLGSNPSADLLRMVLEQEGAEPWIRALDKGVSTSLQRGADGSLALFIINRSEVARTITVAMAVRRLGIAPGARYRLEDVLTGTTRVVKGAALAGLALPVAEHEVGIWLIRKG